MPSKRARTQGLSHFFLMFHLYNNKEIAVIDHETYPGTTRQELGQLINNK